ncbi:ABC transporter permease [Kitasatospora sp. NPDC059827]|uniref:ABC transporter permease n=1 Tax=Kitasatospora sp. NPDC059827 TaxID=3346964 RepID=UPI00365C5EB0
MSGRVDVRAGAGRPRPPVRLGTVAVIRIVAGREIVPQLRSRGFWGSMLLTVVILTVAMAVQAGFSGGGNGGRDVVSAKVGIVGERPEFTGALHRQAATAGADLGVVHLADSATAESALRDSAVDAVVLEDREVLVTPAVPAALGALLAEADREASRSLRLRERGLTDHDIAAALDVAPLRVTVLDRSGSGTRERQRSTVAVFATVVLFFLMLGFGMTTAQGVTEEKSSRIVELLLAKVPAWQLLTGKILGIGVIALVQIAVTLVTGIACMIGFHTVDLQADAVTVGLLVVLWFVPGYVLFSTVFAVAGSLASRQEDLNQVLGPVLLALTGSLAGPLLAFLDPQSAAARILSLTPGFSWSAMPVRMAAAPVRAWEIVVAAVLMLLATAALVRLAGRVYRGGILKHGGVIKVKDALRGAGH